MSSEITKEVVRKNNVSTNILIGDCFVSMQELPAESVHCCITSPPYFGLRDYQVDGQIGLEKTPEEYVQKMVDIFRGVRRVLKNDGTCWLNLGDGYVLPSSTTGGYSKKSTLKGSTGEHVKGRKMSRQQVNRPLKHKLKPKNLIGIPWRVALALQADGWYLRSDIIWSKPDSIPESVKDRPTKAHEYIFLLSKSPQYYFNQDAMKEKSYYPAGTAGKWSGNKDFGLPGGRERFCNPNLGGSKDGLRNKRSVWTVNSIPYKGAHFAVFPPELIKPCVLAGCPKEGTVLDPFGGSGTTACVANAHNRNAVLCELNPGYKSLILQRLEVPYEESEKSEKSEKSKDELTLF